MERRSEQQAGEDSPGVGQGSDDFAAWKNPFSYQCWQGKNLVILRALRVFHEINDLDLVTASAVFVAEPLKIAKGGRWESGPTSVKSTIIVCGEQSPSPQDFRMTKRSLAVGSVNREQSRREGFSDFVERSERIFVQNGSLTTLRHWASRVALPSPERRSPLGLPRATWARRRSKIDDWHDLIWGVTSQTKQSGKPRLRRSFALPATAVRLLASLEALKVQTERFCCSEAGRIRRY